MASLVGLQQFYPADFGGFKVVQRDAFFENFDSKILSSIFRNGSVYKLRRITGAVEVVLHSAHFRDRSRVETYIDLAVYTIGHSVDKHSSSNHAGTWAAIF
jgi:hypothetical protein